MSTAKKLKAATSKTVAPAKADPNVLMITREAGKSDVRKFAELGLTAPTLSTITARAFTKGTLGETDLTESISVMRDKVDKVNAGNMSELEATLAAQSVALDAIFNQLASRAALNMGTHLSATESYMRLALKAQAQCARTIEVLATIKNPPLVIAKQANIANGLQQVNNAAPRVENQKGNNELLEAHYEEMDERRAPAPSVANQAMEAVGAIHRAKEC